MACWADLQRDVLDQIIGRLTNHSDLLRLGHVCRSWRSLAVEKRSSAPRQLPLERCLPSETSSSVFPLLMIPTKDGPSYGRFLSVSDQKLVGEIENPQTCGKWPCSASLGWVLLVDDVGDPEELLLLNPVTGQQIKLPPLSTFPVPQDREEPECPRGQNFVRKAVLDVDPNKSPNNWVLMAIVSLDRRLCYCKSGDTKWTLVESFECPFSGARERLGLLEDIVYFKGSFYLIDNLDWLFTCSINIGTHGVPELEITMVSFVAVPKISPPLYTEIKTYLVGPSQEALILVTRHVETSWKQGGYRSRTLGFEAFRFNENKRDWTKMETLGDELLFLGRNDSLCLSADEYPKLKKNSIYFTDVEDPTPDSPMLENGRDAGVYDYKVGKIRSFYWVEPCLSMPWMWIIPRPWNQQEDV